MKLKKLITAAAVLGAMSFSANASAESLALTNLQTLAGVNPISTSCDTCHTSSTTGARNAFGDAFKNAGGAKSAYALTAAAWTTLAALDSDADGTSNDAEIQAGTNPGVNPIVEPVVSSSGGGCVTSSVTTPLMMVLAMLSLGFFVRRKKD